MRQIILVLAILGLVVSCSASAWAMASEYGGPHSPIIQQSTWPAGLADLLNDGKPVYAYWVNWMDHFYYSGDTEAFNAFLEKYSKLQGTPLTLSIHVGPGRIGRISTPAKRDIAYDWHVFVVPPMIPDGGIVKGQEDVRIVTMELWLGGQVELRQVKAPDSVKVVDGGDIGQFIADLEKARKKANP
jgi:hypothetical protein